MIESVSCVIFCFNEERFIAEAIESVLSQSFTVNEIIVSDDFSTDGTAEIVKSMASKYPQIKYVLSERKGKFHAYKTGLKHVMMDHFFIMAGDDALEKDYVKNSLNFLQDKNLFYSGYKICDANLNRVSIFLGDKDVYLTKDLLHRNWVGGFLFGKSSIIKKILLLDDDRITFEDWVGSIMFSKIFGKVHFRRSAEYLYRRHENATTIKLDKKTLRRRDVKLYEYLLKSDVILFTKGEYNLIKERISLNEVLTLDRPIYPNLLSLLLSSTVRLKEKIKLMLHSCGFSV